MNKNVLFIPILVGFLVASTGCKLVSSIDPPLPGQTNNAPLVAAEGTNVYVLGHLVTPAEFGSAVNTATTFAAGLVVRDYPSATIYLEDTEVALTTVANSGNYDVGTLQTVLNAQVIPKTGADGPLVNSLISTVLSLSGSYLGPLATKSVAFGPFVVAGLNAEVAGLKAVLPTQ